MSKTLLLSALGLSVLLTACQKPQDPASTNTATSEASTQTAPTDPATANSTDLSAETTAYKQWVAGEIEQLVLGTEQFVNALKAGDTQEAKRLYPLVRMHFERSEPIAALFDDLDPRIDNREADLQQGEQWTGFHAIEKILWTQNTTQGTEQLAEQLLADVKQLQATIPNIDMTGEMMIAGAVDLLNEVSTTKITGEEEIFSKTDLYDFQANIDGAYKIFEILSPKINAKDPTLTATLQQGFDEVNQLLASHQTSKTDYKPYDQLTQTDTKALAEAVNKLGEPLAQMAIILQ